MSDPGVSKKFSTMSIMGAIKSAIRAAITPNDEQIRTDLTDPIDTRPSTKNLDHRDSKLPPWREIQTITSYYGNNDKHTEMIVKDDMRGQFDCFKAGVFVPLSSLEKTSYAYCSMFDERLYKWARGQSFNGPIRDFVKPSIYTVVNKDDNVENNAKFAVSYMFHFAPGDKHWIPWSIITGIQGICHLMTKGFTDPQHCPCKGKQPDTRGGWFGFDVGAAREDSWISRDPKNKDRNGWALRWAMDPYVPGWEGLEPFPDNKYPETEYDNGLY